MENIKWYASLGIDFEYRIHSVLSSLNIWQFDALCDWAEKEFKSITRFPKHIPGVFYPEEKVITVDFVQRPPYLDLKIMPEILKTKCADSLEKSKHIQGETQQSILDYLQSDSYNKEYWNEFCIKMNAIDDHTKQNLFDVAPQLEGHMV